MRTDEKRWNDTYRELATTWEPLFLILWEPCSAMVPWFLCLPCVATFLWDVALHNKREKPGTFIHTSHNVYEPGVGELPLGGVLCSLGVFVGVGGEGHRNSKPSGQGESECLGTE